MSRVQRRHAWLIPLLIAMEACMLREVDIEIIEEDIPSMLRLSDLIYSLILPPIRSIALPLLRESYIKDP